jgi:hypothetical protein
LGSLNGIGVRNINKLQSEQKLQILEKNKADIALNIQQKCKYYSL